MDWLHEHLASVAGSLLPLMLDAAIKGAALLIVAASLTMAMRRSSAAARHLVWFLAIAALLFMPIFSATLPGWHILPNWMEPPDAAPRRGAAAGFPPSLAPPSPAAPAPAAPAPGTLETPPPDLGKPIPQNSQLFQPHRPMWQPAPAVPAPPSPKSPTPTPAPPPSPQPASNPQPAHPLTWQAKILLAWLAGSFLYAGYVFFGVLSLRRLARQSSPVTDPAWNSLLRQSADSLACRRPVRLIAHPRRGMPMTWGIYRPRILIPADADRWPAEQRRAVLLHELAHARRWDCLTQLIAQLALAVYWFNPLAWLAWKRIQTEREQACDDLVLGTGQRPSLYAEQLLHIAAAPPPFPAMRYPPYPAAIAMARPGRLEQRLVAILDTKRRRKLATKTATLACLAALLSAGIVATLRAQNRADHPSAAAAPTTRPATQPAAEPPPKWLIAPVGTIDASGAKFGDVIDQLSRASGHPIFVDWPVLDGAKVTRELPVTVALSGLPLGQALTKLLDSVGGTYAQLAYKADENSVLISTRADLRDDNTTLRVYDVRAAIKSAATSKDDLAAIVRRVRGIDPLSWRDAGGDVGSVTVLDGYLIVTQIPQTQERIAAALRDVLPTTAPATQSMATPPSDRFAVVQWNHMGAASQSDALLVGTVSAGSAHIVPLPIPRDIANMGMGDFALQAFLGVSNGKLYVLGQPVRTVDLRTGKIADVPGGTRALPAMQSTDPHVRGDRRLEWGFNENPAFADPATRPYGLQDLLVRSGAGMKFVLSEKYTEPPSNYAFPTPPTIWLDDHHALALQSDHGDEENFQVVVIDLAARSARPVGRISGWPNALLPPCGNSGDAIVIANSNSADEHGHNLAKAYALDVASAIAGAGKLEQRPIHWGDFTLEGPGSPYEPNALDVHRLLCNGKELANDTSGEMIVSVSPDGHSALWQIRPPHFTRNDQLYFYQSGQPAPQQLAATGEFGMPVWFTAPADPAPPAPQPPPPATQPQAVKIWFELFPASPVKSLADFAPPFAAVGPAITDPVVDGESVGLEIRSADNTRCVADVPGVIDLKQNWECGGIHLDRDQIRRIGPIPDGHYLAALTFGGRVRCSNVIRLVIDAKYKPAVQPTLRLAPAPLAPGQKLPDVWLVGTGPTPMDEHFTNASVMFPVLIVDGVKHDPIIPPMGMPVGPIRPGESYAGFVRLANFTPPIAAKAQYKVKAQTAGYESAEITLPAADALGPAWDAATATVKPPIAAIPELRGTILAADGKPAVGAEVILQGPYPSGSHAADEITDDQGHYAFVNVPAGKYMLWAAGETFRIDQLSIQPGKPLVQDFSQVARFKVAGRLSYRSGAPAAGKSLDVTADSDDGQVEFDRTVITGADGRYSVGTPFDKVSSVMLQGTADEGPFPDPARDMKASAGPINLVIPADPPPATQPATRPAAAGPPAGMAARVVDVLGKPVAGATLRSKSPAWSAVTGSGGAFQLPAASGNSMTVDVSATGFIDRKSVDIGLIEAEGGRIELHRAGKLEGRVIGPDGKPLAGAPISVNYFEKYPRSTGCVPNGLQGITDRQGNFSIDDVPPGRVMIYYPWAAVTCQDLHGQKWSVWIKPGEKMPPVPVKGYFAGQSLTLGDGQDQRDIVLDLSKSVAVAEGRVTDMTGKPLAGVSVSVAWKMEGGFGPLANHDGVEPVITDAAGRYELKHLPIGSNYLIACVGPIMPEPTEVQLSKTPTPVPDLVLPVVMTANGRLRRVNLKQPDDAVREWIDATLANDTDGADAMVVADSAFAHDSGRLLPLLKLIKDFSAVSWNDPSGARKEAGEVTTENLLLPNSQSATITFHLAKTILGWQIDGDTVKGNLPPTTQPQPPADQPTMDLLVIDRATGSPMAGVAVKVDYNGHDHNVKTAADGQAAVPVPGHRNGFLEIDVTSAGYVPKMLQWEENDRSPVPASYTITLEKGTTIGGTVVDDAGRPVSGANVVVELQRAVDPAHPHERIWSEWDSVKSTAGGAWTLGAAPSKFQTGDIGVWDYRYANGDFYEMKEFSEKSLRNRSAELILQRGLAVSGMVVGPDGKPIKGASVLTGSQLCSNRLPPEDTNSRGRFRYVAKPGQLVTLTITADGCAPELEQFTMGDSAKDLTIAMSKAMPMRGQVVGPTGEPIAGAWVYPDTWRGNRSLEVQIHCDKQGRFVWKDAPRDTVYCDIDGTERGYVREQHVPLTARDHEIVIKIRKALDVTGTVVDAETNKPIDHFQAIVGEYMGGDSVYWLRDREHVLSGVGGKFEYHASWAQQGYAIRVEAPGYVPAESRKFTQDEPGVHLEFKLKKGTDVTAIILKPDGAPAAGAKAVLAAAGQHPYITNGRDINDQGCQTATAGADGKLDFPPQSGPFLLVVFDADGYVSADDKAVAASNRLTLVPWAQVEGKLLVGNTPAINETIEVQLLDAQVEHDRNEPSIMNWITTTTDAHGHFLIDRIPPGRVMIGREVMQPTGGGGSIGTFASSQKLTLSPGQKVTVQLGGMGRRVVGQVILPPELAAQHNWSWGFGNSCETHNPITPPAMPDNIKAGTVEQQRKWWHDFITSDAGKAYRAAEAKARDESQSFPVQLDSEGHFRIDDVPAGTYDLRVEATRNESDSTCAAAGRPIAEGGAEITVPPMPGGRSDVPLKVPDVPIKMLTIIEPGQPAPAFALKTLDGRDVKLSDFSGKYVLLDFWASWCGPCVAETPSVKAVYDAFGKDPRFAMVSLSLDEKAADAQAYAAKTGMPWTQAFCPGEWDNPAVKAYGVTAIPSIWLISPDGKVIARDLRGAGIKDAVRTALAQSAGK